LANATGVNDALKAEGDTTIYARVSLTAKRILTDVADAEQLSQNEVIELLLGYLGRIKGETADLKAVLHGQGQTKTPLESPSALIRYLQWADHAFTLKHWEWALAAYSLLEKSADKDPGFRVLALYKQGFCWLEVAINLRKEAIQAVKEWRMPAGRKEQDSANLTDDWNSHYDAAEMAVRAALLQYEKFLKLDDHPAVHFNIACCYMLLSQYAIERTLSHKSELIPELNREFGGEQGQNFKLLIKEFCNKWRSEVADKDKRKLLEDKVMANASRAMEQLKTLSHELAAQPNEATSNTVIPWDARFLIHRAGEDADLMLLRHDAKTSGMFGKWFEQQDTLSVRLGSFQKTWDRLTDEDKTAAMGY
jgi:hypothetical protein